MRAVSEYAGPLWEHLMGLDHAALARMYVDQVRKESELEFALQTYREAMAACDLPGRAAEILREAADIASAIEDVMLDLKSKEAEE